jgi:hypothetical protein
MHVRSRHALRATLVAGLVLLAARPAHAQALAPHTPPADVAAAPRKGYGQPVALMVVGGAAVLTGLIIGNDAGTVIAVGGAVMGLYGLYEYLQ